MIQSDGLRIGGKIMNIEEIKEAKKEAGLL